MKEVLLGNEAIVRGALEAGVDFVSGYPGCPAAEVGDIFGEIANKEKIYFEWSVNEKVALEAAIGASFSGFKSLVTMKSFGLNVCSDALLPLCYTGTKAPMVIVVGDDPSCWSSAQTEQNSRGYAYLAYIPMLEPADCQECYDFTKLAFEVSEKFKLPVILRTTIRVAHQRAPVEIQEIEKKKSKLKGEFIKNPHQYVTLPPRVLEMKEELLEKIEKMREFAEKSEINPIVGNKKSELGVIASGVAFSHLMEAQKEMSLDLPVLKLGFFYPLPEKKIISFIKDFKKVLIVEELEGYIEKEVERLAKNKNPKLRIFGKGLLPQIGELNVEKVARALVKTTGKKFKIPKTPDINVPRRFPRLCEGCPYWYVFPMLKRLAPENTIFGGDIGCYMIAGMPPHNIQDYEFCMGSSVGIGHGIKKSTNKKVIALIGDGTFFHAGIPALINAVYNKSNPLIIVLDNRTTAMTGHQPNPGMGKTGMNEEVEELKIEEIARACGVKNIKVLDQINIKEFESAIKEFLEKEEVSLIVCRRMCALLAKKLKDV